MEKRILFSSIQSGDSGTTFWNTTSTFGTPPHRAVGDSGTTFWNTTPTFGTPSHSGTTFWNTTPNFWNTTPFWDNFLEHHPNTTPSSRGDSFLEHHPIDATTRTPTGQGRSSGATTPPCPDRESGTLTGGAFGRRKK